MKIYSISIAKCISHELILEAAPNRNIGWRIAKSWIFFFLSNQTLKAKHFPNQDLDARSYKLQLDRLLWSAANPSWGHLLFFDHQTFYHSHPPSCIIMYIQANSIHSCRPSWCFNQTFKKIFTAWRYIRKLIRVLLKIKWIEIGYCPAITMLSSIYHLSFTLVLPLLTV